MFSKLFRKTETPEVSQPPLFRVRPHYPTSAYWVVDYSEDGGKTWRRVPFAITECVGSPEHSYAIFPAEDKALEFARNMKATNGLHRWIEEQREKYELAKAAFANKQQELLDRKTTII